MTDPSEQPFHLGQMADPPRRRSWPWVVAVLVVLALAAGGVGFWLTRPEAVTGQATAPTVAAAHAACEEAVKERLKSPGTAQFGGQEFRPTQDRGYPATVTGWVDSENSFGALVRNRYQCLAHEGTTWRISDVTFSDW